MSLGRKTGRKEAIGHSCGRLKVVEIKHSGERKGHFKGKYFQPGLSSFAFKNNYILSEGGLILDWIYVDLL